MPLHQFMIQRHLLKTFKCLPKFVYFKKYFQKNGGLIINKFRKKTYLCARFAISYEEKNK